MGKEVIIVEKDNVEQIRKILVYSPFLTLLTRSLFIFLLTDRCFIYICSLIGFVGQRTILALIFLRSNLGSCMQQERTDCTPVTIQLIPHVRMTGRVYLSMATWKP